MTSPSPRRPVLIVGAGPTGLTLAAALRQRGIPFRIVDRRAHRGPTSRAMGIQARTMEVFERLGISDAVTSEALPLKGQAFHLRDRTVVSPFHGVHPRHAAMLILPQSRTEALLEGCVPGVEWGCRFAGMISRHEALLRRDDGSVEAFEAEWIIGCDGAHSGVRDAMGVGFDGTDYDARIWLADCRLQGLDPDLFHIFTDQSMIAFAAPGDLWRVVAVLPPGTPDPEVGDMTIFDRPGIKLSEPQWRSSFSIAQRRAPRLRVERMLLAGDAAHVHSPAGGQGMNVGIQDAWWLADAIERGETAIERWCGERARVADKLLRATDRTTRAMIDAPPWMARIRDTAISLAASRSWFSKLAERNVAGMHYAPIDSAM